MYMFFTAGSLKQIALLRNCFTELVAESRELGEIIRKTFLRVINTGPYFKPLLYKAAKILMVLSLEDEIAQFISLNIS